MSKRPRFLPGFLGIAALSLLGLCAIGAIVGNRLRVRQLARLRAENMPPTITVHSPTAGETTPEGKRLTASATATGVSPIARLELWVNGEQYLEQSPDPGSLSRATTFHGDFDVPVPLGTHVLVFRAVDSEGRVGQSRPIPFVGEPNEGPGETALRIANEGVALPDLAEGLGIEPEDIARLNPGLGQGPWPAGTEVKIPPHPDQRAEKGEPGADGEPPPLDIIPPAPLPVTDPIPPLQTVGIPVITARDLLAIAQAGLPKAPEDLVASFEDCVVTLHWYDYATDESHFTVWMERLGGPPQAIATLEGSSGTGAAEFKFKSPSSGIYGFWVEAANAIGSQESEADWIAVTDLSCGDELATRLEIEALDMSVSGPYQRLYCYVSFDGWPEKRVPEQEETFIQKFLGQWNISVYWGENSLFLVPIPADEELTIEGRCLAWQGADALDTIGSFSVTVPKSQWDGTRLEINADTGAFTIGYRIQYHGPSQARGAYHFTNPELTIPNIVSVSADPAAETAEDPSDRAWAARHLTIEWEWHGDPDAIWGFVIFVDGEERRWVNKQERQLPFLLGTSCGGEMEFMMAAYGPAGERSLVSRPYTYTQPPCEYYAEVHFQTIQTGYTDDCVWTGCRYKSSTWGEIDSYDGDTCYVLQAYYNIWARGTVEVRESYWGRDVSLHFTCKTIYRFDKMGDTDTLIVPIDPLDPRLVFGTTFRDADDWGDDDIAVIVGEVDRPLEQWANYDHTFVYEIANEEAWTETTIRVRGLRSFELAQ